jgi:hypothetical protein
MSQSLKPRFAIDLDEIERQLQSAGSGAQQPAPAPLEAPRPTPLQGTGRNDPLAELARIVGQDDPFGSMLASDRAPAPQRKTPPTFDELFAPRGEPIHPVHTADRWPEPSPRQEATQPYADQRAYDDSAYAEAQPYGQNAAAPAYDERYEDEQAQAYAGQDDGQRYEAQAYEDEPAEPAPRKSRKAMIAVASVLGAAALGVGGVVLFGGKGSPIAGEPPLVMATAGPTKVQPQSPGGVEIPNQNKQIYERAAQDTKTKVVNREEQPVDVRQATRVAAATPDAVTTGSAAPAATNSALGEPRRVRTITIRPDGTVVPDSAPAAAAPAPTTPAQPRPAAAVAAPTTAAPSTPAASTPTPRAAAATPATSTGGASPQAAPAQQPQRVAAVAPAAAAATASDASVGGFSVQLGVAGSEADARKAFQGFQQKFSDLNGQSALIRKAEVNGNTIFRVRVGPMSREEATSLCSKLQGSGCFVAKN